MYWKEEHLIFLSSNSNCNWQIYLNKLSLITCYYVYNTHNQLELIVVSSLIFSVVAMVLSLARIVRSSREGKRKRQSDLFSNVTNITRIIEDEKFVQSRRALRKNKLLNQLKEGNGNDDLVFELDMATEDAARNVASTYDRLGFILKHDKELEDEFIQWQSYLIADMWLLTKDLVTKKWRSKNQSYLKEFERIGKKALDIET
jgi:hypothetical protein